MLMTSELDCLSWLEDFCFVILKSLESFFVFLGIFVLEFEYLSFKLMILVTYCLSPFLASKLICNVSWIKIFDISCRYYFFCNRRLLLCSYFLDCSFLFSSRKFLYLSFRFRSLLYLSRSFLLRSCRLSIDNALYLVLYISSDCSCKFLVVLFHD